LKAEIEVVMKMIIKETYHSILGLLLKYFYENDVDCTGIMC